MKYLIFGYVIAFILEDYGTLQTNSIASCEVELFKNYALDLVLAAIPPLRDNNTLMEGGCECRWDTDEHLNPVDSAVETMCMARDYQTHLKAIRDAENVSAIEVEAGLRENMRRILVVLENWPDNFNSIAKNKTIKTYLLKYKRTAELSDEDVESAMKCHQSLISLKHNANFFDDLFYGFALASALMRDAAQKPESDWQREQLNAAIQGISGCRLETRDSGHTKQSFKKWLVWFYEQETDSDSGWQSD